MAWVGDRAVVRGGLLAGMALAGLAGSAEAGDLPVKAPPPAATSAYDWSGFYVGGHIGYAAGTSGWSATSTGAAAPPIAGALNFFNSYDAFDGTGSYFEGFQAGYNYMSPSRFLFGVEADASFPNTVGGTATFASPVAGLASYSEQVEYSGTLRGRIGYAPNLGANSHWLFYATGGLRLDLRPIHPHADRRRRGSRGYGGKSVHDAADRRRGRRRRRIRIAVELDGAARISVRRLRQSQRHLSGRLRSASIPICRSANCASG